KNPPTIHARHKHIKRDEIRMPLMRERQRGCAVGGLDHAVTFPPHRRSQKVAGVWIVVHDHHERSMLGALRKRGGGERDAAAIGQCDRKGRALPRGARDGNIAAEHLAKTLGNGESKSSAAILLSRRRVGLAEGLEKPALLFL